MKWSQAFISTLKENPADAEIVSHKLMLRAGLIRKLTSGTYIYLPLGQKVLNKVITVVREEMDRAGAQEILMPALQPAEIWEASGRLKQFGELVFQFQDRTGKKNLLGPTHEEIVTNLVKNEITSYRQLPVTLYQIQTKFRDEIRPRFGVLRSKEFLMKDAYSFDTDEKGLDRSYQKMYEAYCRIFERCGLKYKAVEAETGLMGGDVSHEFMVPSPAGEDLFVTCPKCTYASNINTAIPGRPTNPETTNNSLNLQPLQEVKTPGTTTIEAVSQFLKTPPPQMVKTLIYLVDNQPFAFLIRGDHELNPFKLGRLLGTENIVMADAKTIEKVTGGPLGFSGPVGLKNIKILADYAIASMTNFVTGANKTDAHLINTNLKRDFQVERLADLRVVVENDPCPQCAAQLQISRGIEIGHVFKLGTKYSKSLGASFLNEKGQSHPVVMGCYGIGLNRIIAAAIENSSDQNGIIWPNQIAPYQVIIISVNPQEPKINETSQKLYESLQAKNIEVLWDDRNISAGIKFKDADLIGIPIRLTVGKNMMEKGLIDIKQRGRSEQKSFSFDETVTETIRLISG
ncbi:MAG: proline--tRNA ligase [Planctomycetota bacterium]